MVNELYHHGIKGMRWGIRRFQSYDTVPRKSGKSGKFVGKAKIYTSDQLEDFSVEADELSKKHYNDPISRNPSDIIVKKGSVLERATLGEDEHLQDGKIKDFAYMSFNGASYIHQVNGDTITRYLANKDLRIAGKEAIDKMLSEMGKNSLDYRMNIQGGPNLSDHSLDFMNARTYVDYGATDVSDLVFAKDFAKKVKDSGYDGFFDPMDSGINVNDKYNTKGNVPVIMVTDALEKIGSYRPREIADTSIKIGKDAVEKAFSSIKNNSLYETKILSPLKNIAYKKELKRLRKQEFEKSEDVSTYSMVPAVLNDIMVKNPKIAKLAKNWEGDGTEFIDEVIKRTNNKQLKAAVDDDYEKAAKIKREFFEKEESLWNKYYGK